MKKGFKTFLIVLAVIVYTVALYFAFKALIVNGTARVDETETVVDSVKIEAIEIDLIDADLVIKKGDKLDVVTDNKYVTVNETKTRLSVKESRHSVFGIDESTTVTVYIPDTLTIKNLGIETDGDVTVETATINKLILEAGKGDITFDYLNVAELAKIDGGSGTLTISDGTIYNLDLEGNDGEINITSKLKGESEIEVETGNINVNLLKSARHYEIEYEAGAGKATLDGEALEDEKTVGSGEYKLSIEGGVGDIKVTTA